MALSLPAAALLCAYLLQPQPNESTRASEALAFAGQPQPSALSQSNDSVTPAPGFAVDRPGVLPRPGSGRLAPSDTSPDEAGHPEPEPPRAPAATAGFDIESMLESGLGTLAAIERRLATRPPPASTGDDDTWEGSEEARLLDLLLTLDLREAENLALQWLGTDPSPRAVAELGFLLGALSPGAHDAVILEAAERSLITAPVSADVPGELFGLLGMYGNAGTVGLLLDTPWHQDAYASVALAMIPDGSGLDLLAQDARSLEAGRPSSQGRLAVELLAQKAHLDPNAASLLIDLAQRGVIPTDTWPHLLAAASGRQSISLLRPTAGLQSVVTIRRAGGTQFLYRVSHLNAHARGMGHDALRLAMYEELLRYAPTLPGESASWSGG